MKIHAKRFIAIIMSVVMVVTFAGFSFASNVSTETVYIDGEEVTFSNYESGNLSMVTISRDSGEEKIIYNKESGALTVDGKYFGSIDQPNQLDGFSINKGSRATGWVWYDRTWGNIGTDIGDTITIAGLIIAACSVPAGVAASVAGVVIRRRFDWISYTTNHYYYSPVTTSRPRTKGVTVFKDPDGNVIK